jgi:putative tryptophan/tyrosine transport system substrate-binding protein
MVRFCRGRHLQRRGFITLFGGSVVAWPLIARAQQLTMPTVGFLGIESDPVILAGIRQGLTESGYIEGKSVTIEYRWAEGREDRLPALAEDLVRGQVAVIIAAGTPAVAAAKAATAVIPIVFDTGADPVAVGFVASLNRPGGNLTGVTILLAEIVSKQFELLREMIPTASTLAFLYNPTNRTLAGPITRDAQAAAHSLGFRLDVLQASTEREINDAFARLAQLRPDGLVIGPDVFFTDRSEQLAALSVQHSVPAIYHYRGFAAAGGLMSYGVNLPDAYRMQGLYVGRILKGEKPADLPVQRATKVELIVNLKTASLFGITVPLPLSGRADEVIE